MKLKIVLRDNIIIHNTSTYKTLKEFMDAIEKIRKNHKFVVINIDDGNDFSINIDHVLIVEEIN